jgi:peroxiredoxin
LPDIDARFWKKYRDKGLVVVGVNPGGRGGVRGAASTDDIAGLQHFVSKLGVTFPAGVEQTGSYLRFAENFRGSNPFPVDVIVDRDGKIVYVAREYDPPSIEAVLDRLLP